MPKEHITVELGDKTFEVEALSIRLSKVWRQDFAERLQPLFDLLPTLPDIDISKPEELVKLLPLIQNLLTTHLNDAIDLLFEYSPVLQKEREWIGDNASDKQAIAAFLGVLKMTNPFDAKLLRGALTGPTSGETSSKSPAPSGASRKPRSKKSYP